MGESLLLRADASPGIGAGHLMRCIAVAEAWQHRGGEALFITACGTDSSLRQRLLAKGFRLIPLERMHPDPADWESTSAALGAHPGAWVVLDGYHFDSSYQRRVREQDHPLLVIDDTAHLEHYAADLVLNQNLHAPALEYSIEPDTQLLLGTKYALLRSEFSAWRNWRRNIPEIARRVLITMGGGDPSNATLKAILAVEEVDLDGLEAVVVVGPDNPHGEALHAATRASHHKMRVVRSPMNMPELMAWADLSISASGTTVWELASLGVPMFVSAVAQNQEENARQLELAGAGHRIADLQTTPSQEVAAQIALLMRSRDTRALMSARSRQLIDGLGSERAIMRLLARNLRLRPVRQDDCSTFWEWANDPTVRAASFRQEKISWEEHCAWFGEKLVSPAAHIYVALTRDEAPIGQVRLEVDEADATVSVSVDEAWRGKGYGAAVIWRGCRELFDSTRVERIHAYVKQENGTSLLAFARAGFRALGSRSIAGHEAVHLETRREEWVP